MPVHSIIFQHSNCSRMWLNDKATILMSKESLMFTMNSRINYHREYWIYIQCTIYTDT